MAEADIPMELDLYMYNGGWPKGWKILAYGIDGATQNKYIRIAFPNGLMASCISGPDTYGGREGLWEIAPGWTFNAHEWSIMSTDEMRSVLDWSDVQGYLDAEGVNEYLHEIARTNKFRVRTLREAFMKLRAQRR